jgi:hypothetical protein
MTQRRTCRDLAEIAKEIVLVTDNLNTQTPACLYEAFPPRGGSADRRPVGVAVHGQARKLAEHGRDRVGGPLQAVLRPANRVDRPSPTVGGHLERRPQRTNGGDQMAVHHLFVVGRVRRGPRHFARRQPAGRRDPADRVASVEPGLVTNLKRPSHETTQPVVSCRGRFIDCRLPLHRHGRQRLAGLNPGPAGHSRGQQPGAQAQCLSTDGIAVCLHLGVIAIVMSAAQVGSLQPLRRHLVLSDG